MEVMEEITIAVLLLCIKKAKLEKKLNKCITCSIRRILSCIGVKKIEEKIDEIEARINALKNERSNSILYDSLTYI